MAHLLVKRPSEVVVRAVNRNLAASVLAYVVTLFDAGLCGSCRCQRRCKSVPDQSGIQTFWIRVHQRIRVRVEIGIDAAGQADRIGLTVAPGQRVVAIPEEVVMEIGFLVETKTGDSIRFPSLSFEQQTQ